MIVACNDQFLFKYGGVNKFGYIDKTIERYNPAKGRWEVTQYAAKDPTDEIEILNFSLGC